MFNASFKSLIKIKLVFIGDLKTFYSDLLRFFFYATGLLENIISETRLGS